MIGYCSIVKIGITGGAGFIGSNLAEHLLKLGDNVVVVDNLELGRIQNIEKLGCKFVEGDLRDKEFVNRWMETEKVSHVIHLAALGSVPRSIEKPHDSFVSNAFSTLNLLEKCRELGTPLTFSSSSSVYGKNPKLPKDEKEWLSPLSPYAASKLSAEALGLSFRESYDLNVMIYRLFNVFGPRQNPDSFYAAVLPKWIMAAFKKQPLIVFGDGEQKRDFTFVEDVVSILAKSVKTNASTDFPVNLAFGKSVTLNRILEIFSDYFGRIQIQYTDIRKGDVKDSEANPSKLFELFEEDVDITPIETALEKTFNWFKENYKI